MANAGAGLMKEQVLQILKARYFEMLPTRFQNRSLEEQNKDRFSRALAAFAIQKQSGCSDIEAVSSVVDCGNDNGIDAIFYDRRQSTLWLAQSKYGDAPDRASNLTFCNGVEDLLNERYGRFYLAGNNPEFDRVQADVEEAIRERSTKVVACVVYMGNPLGPHAISDLDQLKSSFNELKEFLEWRELGLPVLHGWLVEEQAETPLEVQLTIEKWNSFTNPRRSVFGLVSAAQVNALYSQYGNALFQKNIRHFLGSEAVNVAISQTVQTQPANFFFFNNGITIICSHFDYAGNKDNATFTLSKFSVVNGAQTVGSIGMAGKVGEISQRAKLLVTILEVGEDENAVEFGTMITRTRNTQNAVNLRDFAALDPTQERLRQELAISEVIYYYRPSSQNTTNVDESFSFEDATLALACFSCDTQIIVAAKKEISLVYDRNGRHYPKLFNSQLKGPRLYRYVQIFRYATFLFDNSEITELGRRQMFFRHGRFFICHIWAMRNQRILNKLELILSEDDKLLISDGILKVAEVTYRVAEQIFAATDKGYLTIFRNATDVEPLLQAVLDELKKLDDLEQAL